MAGGRAEPAPAERDDDIEAEHRFIGLEPSVSPTAGAVGGQHGCGAPAAPACPAATESKRSERGAGKRFEERNAIRAEKYPEQRRARCSPVHRERRVRPNTPAETGIASRGERSGRSETSSIGTEQQTCPAQATSSIGSGNRVGDKHAACNRR